MNQSLLLLFAFLSMTCGAIVKREAFSVQSSEDEEEIFRKDILGQPLSKNDFQLGEKLTDRDEDKIDETRAHGNKDATLLAGLFEGDIRGINDTEGRNGILNRYKKWPGGTIPYVISSGYNAAERGVISRAMNFYHTKTCIRFVPKSNERDYIHISRGRGCSSHVGRKGGVQYVSLGNGCIASGTIQHELMHAAGFWHEQSRHDRDTYIEIIWTNILKGMEFNFQKVQKSKSQTFGQSYDYKSLMHYNPYAFSKYRGRATIVPRQKGVTIGNRKQLSSIDLAKLNALYECFGKVVPTPSPTGVTDVSVTDNGNLVDLSKNCGYWANIGECLSNPRYMLSYCKRSCSRCALSPAAKCVDNHSLCNSWAKANQCQSNPGYMLKYCKFSCNACPSASC